MVDGVVVEEGSESYYYSAEFAENADHMRLTPSKQNRKLNSTRHQRFVAAQGIPSPNYKRGQNADDADYKYNFGDCEQSKSKSEKAQSDKKMEARKGFNGLFKQNPLGDRDGDGEEYGDVEENWDSIINKAIKDTSGIQHPLIQNLFANRSVTQVVSISSGFEQHAFSGSSDEVEITPASDEPGM